MRIWILQNSCKLFRFLNHMIHRLYVGKRSILPSSFLLFFLLSCDGLKAQIPVWYEDFGLNSGACDQLTLAQGFPATGGGTWTITNLGAQDTAANQWYISSTDAGSAIGTCSGVG